MKRSISMILVAALAFGAAAMAVAGPAPMDPQVHMALAGVGPAELGMAAVAASAVLGGTVQPAEQVSEQVATAMRAKFVVGSVERFESAERVKFSAVSKSGGYPDDGLDEDNTFAKWSPSASCEILITNPALHGKFTPGQKFYVDFTPAAG